MMESDLDRMLEAVAQLPAPADVNAVFGAPATSGNRTVIPVAAVAYDFELAAERPTGAPTPDGGNAFADDQGSGQVRSRPVAVVEVTSEGTAVRPVVDYARVLPRLLLLAGWATGCLAFAIARSRRRGG
jgi:uncharacterized spore protein YtfJ